MVALLTAAGFAHARILPDAEAAELAGLSRVPLLPFSSLEAET